MREKITTTEMFRFGLWLMATLATVLGVQHLSFAPRDTGLGVGEVTFGVIVGAFVAAAGSRHWFGWSNLRGGVALAGSRSTPVHRLTP